MVFSIDAEEVNDKHLNSQPPIFFILTKSSKPMELKVKDLKEGGNSYEVVGLNSQHSRHWCMQVKSSLHHTTCQWKT